MKKCILLMCVISAVLTGCKSKEDIVLINNEKEETGDSDEYSAEDVELQLTTSSYNENEDKLDTENPFNPEKHYYSGIMREETEADLSLPSNKVTDKEYSKNTVGINESDKYWTDPVELDPMLTETTMLKMHCGDLHFILYDEKSGVGSLPAVVKLEDTYNYSPETQEEFKDYAVGRVKFYRKNEPNLSKEALEYENLSLAPYELYFEDDNSIELQNKYFILHESIYHYIKLSETNTDLALALHEDKLDNSIMNYIRNTSFNEHSIDPSSSIRNIEEDTLELDGKTWDLVWIQTKDELDSDYYDEMDEKDRVRKTQSLTCIDNNSANRRFIVFMDYASLTNKEQAKEFIKSVVDGDGTYKLPSISNSDRGNGSLEENDEDEEERGSGVR